MPNGHHINVPNFNQCKKRSTKEIPNAIVKWDSKYGARRRNGRNARVQTLHTKSQVQATMGIFLWKWSRQASAGHARVSQRHRHNKTYFNGWNTKRKKKEYHLCKNSMQPQTSEGRSQLHKNSSWRQLNQLPFWLWNTNSRFDNSKAVTKQCNINTTCKMDDDLRHQKLLLKYSNKAKKNTWEWSSRTSQRM